MTTLLRRQQGKLQRLGRGAGLEPNASSESEASVGFEQHDEIRGSDDEEIEFSAPAMNQIFRLKVKKWIRTATDGAGLC